jgi:hypothetical protein
VNDLQHQRLAELSRKLRLSTVPRSLLGYCAACSSELGLARQLSGRHPACRARRAPARCSHGVAGFPTVKEEKRTGEGEDDLEKPRLLLSIPGQNGIVRM